MDDKFIVYARAKNGLNWQHMWEYNNQNDAMKMALEMMSDEPRFFSQPLGAIRIARAIKVGKGQRRDIEVVFYREF